MILSYLIAALASYAGLLMSVHRQRRNRPGPVGLAGRWIGSPWGSASGPCISPAMLALTLPVAVSYDVPITILSVVPAILASARRSGVMTGRSNRHRRYIIGGTLVGAGIGAMHYIGMAAMHVEYCVHPYNPLLFALSVIVAWRWASPLSTLAIFVIIADLCNGEKFPSC